jgi:uncharacterized damage-inducible protein DinB
MPAYTDIFIAELDSEVERSRRALAHVPANKHDWKPHEKSMPFGYLTSLVAVMPSWIAMMVTQDELDVAPATPQHQPPATQSAAELLAALEEAAKAARAALRATNDAHLETNWRLLARGQVVAEQPRHVMIRDTFAHQAHHRGQLTVYLRLLGATVPALYGPSADDKRFD